MSEKALSRRSFIAGTAGLCTLAAAGTLGSQGFAATNGRKPVESSKSHCVCGACPQGCGFTAYVVEGKLDKLIGDESNPQARGRLCAKGYGYSQVVYSPDRIQTPLRRNASGKLEAVSWDEAVEEIAQKLKSIDAGAIAAITDGSPTSSWYLKRLMNALGSANVYVDDASINVSAQSGIAAASGFEGFTADIENTGMLLVLGNGYAESATPAQIADLTAAKLAGANIVLAAPRADGMSDFAGQWLPVNAGTELALALALANVLVKNDLYDQDFVKANAKGFDEFVQAVAQYTPEWAESLTGIRADLISQTAVSLAQAAPAAIVDVPQAACAGNGFANSMQTARVAALLNGLLGSWNQKGGVIAAPQVVPAASALDAFPAVAEPAGPAAGMADYPLATQATAAAAIDAMAAGTLKAALVYECDPAAEFASAGVKALEALDLLVVVATQTNATADAADYVLPAKTYLECDSLPLFTAGLVPAVALGSAAIEAEVAEARSIDEIALELAQAAGVGEAFPFSLDEVADAMLTDVGYSLAALVQTGSASFPLAAFDAYGEAPAWKTAEGKLLFASAACEDADLGATPEWIAPEDSPEAGSLRLLSGEQYVHFATRTYGVEELSLITQKYGLDDVLIGAQTAEALGIADGNQVKLVGSGFEGTAEAHVTQLINPGCAFLPVHYALAPADFAPFKREKGCGAALVQETFVQVGKVGA